MVYKVIYVSFHKFDFIMLDFSYWRRAMVLSGLVRSVRVSSEQRLLRQRFPTSQASLIKYIPHFSVWKQKTSEDEDAIELQFWSFGLWHVSNYFIRGIIWYYITIKIFFWILNDDSWPYAMFSRIQVPTKFPSVSKTSPIHVRQRLILWPLSMMNTENKRIKKNWKTHTHTQLTS